MWTKKQKEGQRERSGTDKGDKLMSRWRSSHGEADMNVRMWPGGRSALNNMAEHTNVQLGDGLWTQHTWPSLLLLNAKWSSAPWLGMTQWIQMTTFHLIVKRGKTGLQSAKHYSLNIFRRVNKQPVWLIHESTPLQHTPLLLHYPQCNGNDLKCHVHDTKPVWLSNRIFISAEEF